MRRLASIVSVVRLLLVVGTPTALAVYEVLRESPELNKQTVQNKLVIELHGGRGERVNVKRAGLSGVAAAPTSRELQRPGGGLAPLVSAVGPIGVSRDDSQQLSANIREVSAGRPTTCGCAAADCRSKTLLSILIAASTIGLIDSPK